MDCNTYDVEADKKDDRDRRFEAQEYVKCKEWEIPKTNNDANPQDGGEDNAEEVQYYIRPHYSADGGAVDLGLYTNETCLKFADKKPGKTTRKTLSFGQDLPYGTASLATSDCVSCVRPEDPNRSVDKGDDAAAGEQASDFLDQYKNLYESASK